MDKKVLYALTTKIFNTLKKLGIKPKIGVTTDIQRLPGINSFNADLSNLKQARPESLKKLITTDADFLAKADPDELRQYYNNLEYLQSTFPKTFAKPQVVIESKTGLKTLVDDAGEPNTINISDPKTAEDFTNFAKQNDPEGFKKIQKITDDINNKNILEDFDIKDREPNAKGGSVGNLTYKKMFGDLDKTLNKGLGTMFKKRKR